MGGQLDIDDVGNFHCAYCGYWTPIKGNINKFIKEKKKSYNVKKESYNVNINRMINDADVIRARTDLMREKIRLGAIIAGVVIGAILLLLLYNSIVQYKKDHPEFRITMKVDSSDLLNRPYQETELVLKDHGFTSIECISLNDLTKPDDHNIGKVQAVSIGGKGSFSADGFMKTADVFMSNEPVRIYYHSLNE